MAKKTPLQKYSIHPICSMVPEMSSGEYSRMKEDIKARGIREAIVIYEEKILDGRNRYRACRDLGVAFKTKQYRGNDPMAFVWSCNGVRRNLSASQLACFAAEIAEKLQKTDAAPKRKGISDDGRAGGRGRKKTSPRKRVERATEKAAKITGAKKTTTEQALSIKRKDPKLFAAVKSGKKTVGGASKEITNRNPANQSLKVRYPVSTMFMKVMNDIVAISNFVWDEHETVDKMFKHKQWDKQKTDGAVQLLEACHNQLGKMLKEAKKC